MTRVARKRRRMTWGEIYYANLARGYDHGYAAFRADEAERFWERKRVVEALEPPKDGREAVERCHARDWC